MQPEPPYLMKSAAEATKATEETTETASTPVLTLVGPTIQVRPGHGPNLLMDTPIMAVLDGLRSDIATLQRLDPSSGSLSTLRDYEQRLRVAVEEGRKADAWVTTEEAARHLNISVSAVTKRCRLERIKCRKGGGVWLVHKDALTGKVA